MLKRQLKASWLSVFAVLTAIILFAGEPTSAADIVSGRYISSAGKTIELAINIQSPSPASLIIEQYLPPGTMIKSSQPKLKKYNIKKGKAKWLLKNVRTGKIKVTLHLADKVGKENIRALLRCKDPATGSFVEQIVVP